MSVAVPWLLTSCLSLPVGEPSVVPDGPPPVDHGIVASEALASDVDAIVLPVLEAGGINVAVSLVKGSDILFTGAYGWADLDTETPMTVDTPMAMASVSKTFIGIAAMQAVQAGQLTLDDPLADLVGFPVDNPKVPGATLTLRHVLTHHSGLEDSLQYVRSYDLGDPTVSLRDFVEGYVTPGGEVYRRSNFSSSPPGESFSYSNVGSGLAALAVGAASGREFADVVRQDILAPLGMENSGYFLSELPVPPATQYDQRMRPYPAYGYPTYPDGMMRSSAQDMARYVAMVQGDGTFDGTTLLTPDSVRTLLTVDPQLGTDEDGQAIMWVRLGYIEGRPLMGHPGGDPGTLAVMGLDRSSGAGVVLMMNSESGGIDALFPTIEPLLEVVDRID